MTRRHHRQALAQETEFIEEVLGTVQVAEPTEQALSEFLIPYFLNFEVRYTDRELCGFVERSFGITFSLNDLARLQRSAAFQSLWPLGDFGTDPRVAVTRHRFAELLSTAMEQLDSLLTMASTPASVKMKAIELILKMNEVEVRKTPPSNSAELVKFFEGLGVTMPLAQINIGTLIHQTLPDAYREAADAVASPTPERNLLGVGAQGTGDVVDGEFEESQGE